MNITTVKKEHLHYLDTLKFILCMMIFWTHYTNALWLNIGIPFTLHPAMNILFRYPLSFFYDSGIALYGFFLISGFLAAGKKISGPGELLTAVLNRYLRFLVPFFFCNLFCMVLYYLGAFKTIAFFQTLQNPWLASYYDHAPSLFELIRSTLFLEGDLNGPLWMMKYLFWGTVVIYVYRYLETLVSPVLLRPAYILLLLISLPASFLVNGNLYQIHVAAAGLPLSWLISRTTAIQTENSGSPAAYELIFTFLAILAPAMEAGGLQRILYPAMKYLLPSAAHYFVWNNCWCFSFSFVWIYALSQSKSLQKVFSLSFLHPLGKLSFPIYLIHWPLICSFSLWFCLTLLNRISYAKIFFFDTLLTVFLLLLTAGLYIRFIDPAESALLIRLQDLVRQLFYPNGKKSG